jgi:hypothetical protein
MNDTKKTDINDPLHNRCTAECFGSDISLCRKCYCMTKTIDGVCGKCGKAKQEGEKMNATERIETTKKFEENMGMEAKKIKWKIITVETKDSPNKPKSMIKGEVAFIYPTGDIMFSKILAIDLWYPEENKMKSVDIPKHYKEAKKICIRREIVAAVLYNEEL